LKKRLDRLLVERGLADSRTQGQALIMSGKVKVDGVIQDKPGHSYPLDVEITVTRPLYPYVSRGGIKLEKALDCFRIDVRKKVCMDVGASTGGFTHCLLMRGAKRVFSVDVGFGQLDWSLRNDPRVVVLERTNFRYLEPETIRCPMDIITIDVSFISLRLILPVAKRHLARDGVIVALIKPQFEAGPKEVGKGGIVRNPAVHEKVTRTIITFSQERLGLRPIGIIMSPILGAKGNREFLVGLKNQALCHTS